jgi:ribokinase
MQPPIKILGLGCVTVDDLLYVDEYPAADTKTQIRSRDRQCGGLTATALVAAARMGARCGYAGALGDDDLSRFVVDQLQKEGIDTALVRLRPGARPIHSTIVVEESRQTRTIFFDLHGVSGAEPDWPPDEAIRAAGLLFVDHIGMAGMIRAARIARAAGVPVVADLERDEDPQFPVLLGLVDHLILSRDFAGKLTGETVPAAMARALWSPGRRAAVVTSGREGCWYVAADRPQEVRHQPAFAVDVVDTTGCGDVFHGVYAAATVRRLDPPAALRLASAAAALKATRRGGQAGIPSLPAVQTFLEKHGG